MSDAIQAAAYSFPSDWLTDDHHYEIAQRVVRAYIKAVAGCDCDPPGSRWAQDEYGDATPDYEIPCERCVVVDLPDIKGVRVRHEATDEDFDTGEVNAVLLEVVGDE